MTKFLKAKDRIDAFFAVIAKGAQVIAACFLCIMIVAVSVQVVGRICHFKIPVTEEIGTYSLIWMTYIASIAVIIKGEHLTVDLFLNRYKPATRRIVRLFVDILVLIFCGMLMFIAVDCYRNVQGSTLKFIGVFVPVMVFILSGFEHVIANMYYFSLAGAWSGHCLASIVVMTLGNAVGGMLIPLYLKIFKVRV